MDKFPTEEKYPHLNFQERLALLNELAIKNTDVPVSSYLQELFPNLHTLDAVQELRSQIHHEKTEAKPLYPGLRSHLDPIKYLLDNYGEDIASGLGPGQLSRLDHLLYSAVSRRLQTQTPSVSIGEFFRSQTDLQKQKPAHQRRIEALATILGTTPEHAVRFASTMQPRRLSSYTPNSRSSARY